MNHYEMQYQTILEIQAEILPDIKDFAGFFDYKAVNALSAAYILQDYLAGKISQAGETPEGEHDWISK